MTVEDYYVGECDLRLGCPLQHWLITLGDTAQQIISESVCQLAAKDLRRMQLALAAGTTTNLQALLCPAVGRSPLHLCVPLPRARKSPCRSASSVHNHLPDPAMESKEFAKMILGTVWIDGQEVHVFAIEYLCQLMSACLDKLITLKGNSPEMEARKLYPNYILNRNKNSNVFWLQNMLQTWFKNQQIKLKLSLITFLNFAFNLELWMKMSLCKHKSHNYATIQMVCWLCSVLSKLGAQVQIPPVPISTFVSL